MADNRGVFVCKMLPCIFNNNRLLREVVDALSMETFKVRLDGTLSNLISLKISLLTARGLDCMTLKVCSKPNHSMFP